MNTTERAWTPQALRVLEERYLATKEDGTKETPEDMCRRVANALAEGDRTFAPDDKKHQTHRKWSNQYYNAMANRELMPNSPCLQNAGMDNGQCLSACFVVPVNDSLLSDDENQMAIFDAVSVCAKIHSAGGGTGMSFGELRPRGAKTKGGSSSGAVSFMRVFDAATQQIKQAGVRRGANMGTLPCSHPDIEEFINCKKDGSINNFNISVSCTDAFMEAVEMDFEWELRHPRGGKPRLVRARSLWEQICDAAWATGDPGLQFIDRVNRSRSNPIPTLETIQVSNPCGEIFMHPFDACNLLSINLATIYDWKTLNIDVDKLRGLVRLGVRMLDNMIDINVYPLPAIDAKVKSLRRIGLGVMGWADLLNLLEIHYDSTTAIDLARKIGANIQREAEEETVRLAEERGAFPLFEQSIYKDGPKRRNCCLTMIAPTGTIGIIAGCSTGIEPLFQLSYQHDNHLGRVMEFIDPRFQQACELLDQPAILAYVKEHGSFEGHMGPIHPRLAHFVTSHELSVRAHLNMLSIWQQFTDNSISKTINLPETATRDDVSEAYHFAYDMGCKSVTVYRNNCKGQVLTAGIQKSEKVTPKVPAKIIDRPRQMGGTIYKVDTPIGVAYVTISYDDDHQAREVFINVGKAGSDIAAMSEGLGRLLSMILRMPTPMTPVQRVEEMIHQLRGIGGSQSVGLGVKRVRSLPDAISQVLAEFVGHGTVGSNGNGGGKTSMRKVADFCPECGNYSLVHEEGCAHCPCGHSVC